MATKTIQPGSHLWSEEAAWGGAVPAGTDDVVANAESGDVTIEATAKDRILDLTSYTGKLVQKAKLEFGSTPPAGVLLKFPTAGWTYESSGSTASFEFKGAGSNEVTVDFGGKSVYSLNLVSSAKIKLLSAVTTLATATGITHTKGTFDVNGQTISTSQVSGTGTEARELKLGAATILLTGTGSVWNFTTVTNLTFSGAESTITIANTGSSEKKFIGGGKTYGTIAITGGGTGVVVLGATNGLVCNVFKIGAPKSVKLGAEKTHTITKLEGIGTAGNLITLESTESGKKATIALTEDYEGDYLSLKDIKVTGGKFYAGSHSKDEGGNEGVLFEDAAAAPTMGSPTSTGVIARDLTETINANGKATTYYFQLVTDTQFKIDEWASATKVPTEEASAGESSEAKEVTQLARGLSNGTKYHFRCIAKNSKGTSTGPEQTFTPTSGGSFALIETLS